MIRIASKQAKKSTFERYKLGAVIVKKGRVMSVGYNEIRYNSELRKSNIHAEEAAIMKLLRTKRLEDLAGSTIYVSRIRANGSTGLAKPCGNCDALIKSVGIRAVVYTTSEGTTETYKC
jgi:deoxycytidylate deaminase